jgi:hypothetical protein
MQIRQIFKKQIALGGYLFVILLAAAPPLFVHRPFPSAAAAAAAVAWIHNV